MFTATFQGKNLTLVGGFFSKPDSFLTVSRVNESGHYSVVWRSACVKDSTTPNWGSMRISLSALCNADRERPLQLTVWEYTGDGKNKEITKFATTVEELLQNGTITIENTVKKDGKKPPIDGVLCENCHLETEKNTFPAYIQGGCEISLIVGIDFTYSNGDPKNTSSLHYIDPQGIKQNPYQKAILAVGKILEEYDTDKKYPVYGFGAAVRGDKGQLTLTSHCFPVHDPTKGEVEGVSGILNAYNEKMKNLSLTGPTNFAPLLEKVNEIAVASPCT
jgi:hypothetical protein